MSDDNNTAYDSKDSNEEEDNNLEIRRIHFGNVCLASSLLSRVNRLIQQEIGEKIKSSQRMNSRRAHHQQCRMALAVKKRVTPPFEFENFFFRFFFAQSFELNL